MEITYEACVRYVRGEATLTEARAVRSWLADPTNEAQAQEWMGRYAAETQPAAGTTDPYNYAAMRENLHAQLGRAPAPQVVPLHLARPTWWRWAAAAAVAGLTAGGSWLWQAQHQPAALATASYSTPYGQTRLVQLPDGSEVTLNAHSTLRYAATADARQPREVWLDGEAFFSVKHTVDNKRFVVHTTGNFNVEVLGTKFTVYRRHEQARVVLLSGKVRVDFTDQTQTDVILKPGELLQTVDAKPKAVVHKAVKAASYAAWTDDRMSFDATSLAEVATRLQDTYGVEVIVADSALNQRKFTGTFPTANLDVLCEDLAEAFHLRIEHQQNRLILFRKPVSHPSSHE
ncbi:FecR family protein [Hymenobacter negativus]|uniref:FecR domain-containing protein n=1 Tax=Hymenobacter negativus TaxID=2795026 RepID=A0ABS3QLL6_9BACT|nr:FecR domain-containing protein [Hymenobacter negativus]MBO2012148.1 FecR domain-containing protein [Hymenobacter negativus]